MGKAVMALDSRFRGNDNEGDENGYLMVMIGHGMHRNRHKSVQSKPLISLISVRRG